jgi:hypothetical protein
MQGPWLGLPPPILFRTCLGAPVKFSRVLIGAQDSFLAPVPGSWMLNLNGSGLRKGLSCSGSFLLVSELCLVQHSL